MCAADNVKRANALSSRHTQRLKIKMEEKNSEPKHGLRIKKAEEITKKERAIHTYVMNEEK